MDWSLSIAGWRGRGASDEFNTWSPIRFCSILVVPLHWQSIFCSPHPSPPYLALWETTDIPSIPSENHMIPAQIPWPQIMTSFYRFSIARRWPCNKHGTPKGLGSKLLFCITCLIWDDEYPVHLLSCLGDVKVEVGHQRWLDSCPRRKSRTNWMERN